MMMLISVMGCDALRLRICYKNVLAAKELTGFSSHFILDIPVFLAKPVQFLVTISQLAVSSFVGLSYGMPSLTSSIARSVMFWISLACCAKCAPFRTTRGSLARVFLQSYVPQYIITNCVVHVPWKASKDLCPALLLPAPFPDV
jgi:hypothetical protein